MRRYKRIKNLFGRFVLLIAISQLGLFAHPALSKGVYFTKEALLNEIFPDGQFQQKTLWVKGELKQELQHIFERKSVGLRARYWQGADNKGAKTLWILDEIGKELPITIGVVISENAIQRIVVMEYRESRGAEIKNASFTKQFVGAILKKRDRLSHSVDGITGATLSVKAMKRVATAALVMQRVAEDAS